jgi:hypothetical protein
VTINNEQFNLPTLWPGAEKSKSFSKCSGEGPFGAGCQSETNPGTDLGAGLIGTKYQGRRSRDVNFGLCRNCEHDAKVTRHDDQHGKFIRQLRAQGGPIEAHWQESVEHEVGGERFDIMETRRSGTHEQPEQQSV